MCIQFPLGLLPESLEGLLVSLRGAICQGPGMCVQREVLGLARGPWELREGLIPGLEGSGMQRGGAVPRGAVGGPGER